MHMFGYMYEDSTCRRVFSAVFGDFFVCVCSLGRETTFISKGWDQNHKVRKFYKIVLLAAQHASEKLSGFGVITLRNSEIA